MMVGVFEGCWKLKDELEVVLEGVLEIVWEVELEDVLVSVLDVEGVSPG